MKTLPTPPLPPLIDIIEKTTETPRQLRHQTLADTRRELILDAARAAFFELGIEKTSIREIARRAGYTPGAIYSYFTNKEELYATLLGESLKKLNEHIQKALTQHTTEITRLRASATAFFHFYQQNPRDLDLGFYLFQGIQPRGLTPPLNQILNARLRNALQPTQDALQQLGIPAQQALQETTALFAHTVGLLILSHSGRIRMFNQTPQNLHNTYLEQLIHRLQPTSKP